MKWKLIPMTDQPQGPSTHHSHEIHEGDEDSLSVRLSDLQAMTGTPYRAEEWNGEEEPSEEEQRDAVERQEHVKAKQDEAEEKGRPVEL